MAEAIDSKCTEYPEKTCLRGCFLTCKLWKEEHPYELGEQWYSECKTTVVPTGRWRRIVHMYLYHHRKHECERPSSLWHPHPGNHHCSCGFQWAQLLPYEKEGKR